MSGDELRLASPVLAVLGAAVAALGIGISSSRRGVRDAVEWAAYFGLLGAILLVHFAAPADSATAFNGALVGDKLSRFVSLAILIAAALTVLVSIDPVAARGVLVPEYVALLLTCTAGLLLLVMAGDLITLFLAVEILSIALYVLCGICREDPRSNEAGMKYFVLGAFATGFLLYGMALLYGATGTVQLDQLGARLAAGDLKPLGLAGIVLLVVGFAFKIGAAPFHMWVPDVYEGAPTAVTGFMSVAVKAAGVGALARILVSGLPNSSGVWSDILWVLAALTVVVGNLGALTQVSVKRMLAYSSIAHTGYALIGFAVFPGSPGDPAADGPAAAIFYTFAYTVMTVGAFMFLGYAGRPASGDKPAREAETFDDLAGLARRRPVAAALMTVFMISLAGLPPTAGFFGKFLLLKSAVDAGHLSLAILVIVTSLVSVAYYLRVVVAMYMKEPPEGQAAEAPERPDFNVGMAVVIAAVLTLALGLYPVYYLNFSRQAVEMLVGR